MIFQSGKCQMWCRTGKNHQINKNLGEMKKTMYLIFTIILITAFGTKNVHTYELVISGSLKYAKTLNHFLKVIFKQCRSWTGSKMHLKMASFFNNFGTFFKIQNGSL